MPKPKHIIPENLSYAEARAIAWTLGRLIQARSDCEGSWEDLMTRAVSEVMNQADKLYKENRT